MFNRGKVYTVYEKPEAPEPTARVALVREGFAFWALIFGLVWLLANRLWLSALGYVLASAALAFIGNLLAVSDITLVLLQLWLQFMLAAHAYDLMRWNLARRQYRFAGIITAESPIIAERRYYEFAQ